MNLIAYDKRTGVIRCSWIKPWGDYTYPDWDHVFRGDRDIVDNLEVIETPLSVTTREAQKLLRVVDGQVVDKPQPVLTIGKVCEGKPCDIVVTFNHLLDGEIITDLQVIVTGFKLTPVELILQPGSNLLTFDILGALEMKTIDKRTKEAVVRFEVVP